MKNLYVLGDSISIAYGPALEQALAGKLAYARKSGVDEALENLDVPTGANAGDSRMLRAYLEHRFKDPTFKPDILLVNCGLHDIKMHDTGIQISLLEFKDNVSAVARLALANQVRMMWVRITPVDDHIHNTVYKTDFKRFSADVAAYNEVADEIMTELDIPIIDLHGFTTMLGEDIFADHVHYKPGIYAQQGAWIAEEILSYLD